MSPQWLPHPVRAGRAAHSRQVRVQRLYPKTVLKPAVRTMLIPVPRTAAAGGVAPRDGELLAWCGQVIGTVLVGLPVP
jgi:transcription-repair coupling factor (superfamily II helicase)